MRRFRDGDLYRLTGCGWTWLHLNALSDEYIASLPADVRALVRARRGR